MSVQEQPWADGTPCWAELAVPDLDLGRQFYGALLGWDWEVGPEETGFYSQGLLGGRRVAALNGYRPDPDAPVAWLTFLATSDAAATADRAVAAGAQVPAPVMDVMGYGRMAVLVDPVGAPVALWQAGTSVGAQVVDEPGAMTWNEHLSAHPGRARDFYAAVAGWTYTDLSAPGFDYTSAEAAGRTVGGIGGLGGTGGGAGAPGWAVYFAVADTDATAAAAVRLGGAVHAAPQDSPYGRLAGVTGPFGERFWLMSTDEPRSAPAA